MNVKIRGLLLEYFHEYINEGRFLHLLISLLKLKPKFNLNYTNGHLKSSAALLRQSIKNEAGIF